MADPGRLTSNPHKAKQWQARYWRFDRPAAARRRVSLVIVATTGQYTKHAQYAQAALRRTAVSAKRSAAALNALGHTLATNTEQEA